MDIKKQLYIILSSFFLANLFLILFFVYPVFLEIQENSSNLISQKISQSNLEKQFSEASKFKQKYEDYKPNLTKVDGLFVDSQNPVVFIEFLEKTSNTTGTNLQISTPSVEKNPSSTYATFQLSISGTFSGIVKFLKSVELGPYLVNEGALNIRSAKNQTMSAEILIKASSK